MEVQISISILDKKDILVILPFLKILDPDIAEETLKSRVLAMAEENYRCLGIYDGNTLIGVCGLWYMTRHYCGKSLEPDHVIILEKYRGKGIGEQLFNWIFDYARQNGFEATELNTYVSNTSSHKFYYNLGYEIKGFHFVKIL